MLITNWLAKKDGIGGLAFKDEIASGNVRIFGNVYGNPNFADGEYVRTGKVKSFDGEKVVLYTGEEYTLLKEEPQYLNYLQASQNGLIVVKNWNAINGLLVGETLDSTKIQGKVISQNFTSNISQLSDGRRLYVDWLSKAPDVAPVPYYADFYVFCVERCMPDIFGKHYPMFRSRG